MKIKEPFERNKLFFTSDLHFNHRSILAFRKQFKNTTDMNNSLIKNWNKVVSDDDTVFILGDVALGGSNKQVQKLLLKLNGKKHLVVGNHDDKILRTRYIRDLFSTISDYCVIKVTDVDSMYGMQKIVLSHYPFISWEGMHNYTIQLYGHTHGNLKEHHPKQLEVGVDLHNFTPISYLQVKKLMK